MDKQIDGQTDGRTRAYFKLHCCGRVTFEIFKLEKSYTNNRK